MSLADALNPFGRSPSLPHVDIPQDEAIDAIRNERRRFALAFVYDSDGYVTLDDLATERAAIEAGPDWKSPARKRVYIAYYQTHLPKLDRLGAITYDQDRGVIEPTSNTDALAQWAQLTQEGSV